MAIMAVSHLEAQYIMNLYRR